MAEIDTLDQAPWNVDSVDNAPWNKSEAKPMSGGLWDHLASTGDFGRVLSKFGQGAEEGWGYTMHELAPETEAILKNTPSFKEIYDEVGVGKTKAFNETFGRTAVWASLLKRLEIAPVAGFFGMMQGAGAAGIEAANILSEEAKRREESPSLLPDVGRFIASGASEILGATASGQYGGNDIGMPMLAHARAKGVIGEGEIGYFNTSPLTELKAKQRAVAAQEAGIPQPKIPEPPVMDIDVLARRVNPELFDRHDGVLEKMESIREKKQELNSLIQSFPEPEALQNQLIRLREKKTLSNKDQARLEQLEDLEQKNLKYQQLNSQLANLDLQLREMIPDVNEAYEHAKTLLPDLHERAQADWYKSAEQYTSDLTDEFNEKVTKSTFSKETGEVSLPTDTTEPPVPPKFVPGTPSETQTTNILGGKQPISGPLKSVEGTGELKERGLSQSLEMTAVENHLVEEFGDLPEYHQVSMKEQSIAAVELLNKDYERAKAIAMGLKKPPVNLLPESVLVAVEKRAIVEKDIDLLRDLATRGKLPEQATTMGQRLRTLAERNNISPMTAIHEVQARREAALQKNERFTKAIKNVVSELTKVIQKNAPDKDTVKSFIESIQCPEGEG